MKGERLQREFLDIVCYYGARLILFFMRTLPESFGLALCRFCVRVLIAKIGRADGVGMHNLSLMFPEKSREAHRAILDQSYEVLARNLMGFATIGALTKENISKAVDYEPACEFTDSVHREGKGMLIITMHYGSFERLVQFQAVMKKPVSMLARGFNLPRVDEWWDKQREQWGNKVFRRKGGYRQVIQRLERGEDVAMLCDQNVKRKYAVFVPFFGINAATTKGPGIAAIRTGARVTFVVMADNCDGTFELVFSEMPNPTSLPGSAEEQVREFTRLLNEKAEEAVRRRPEQWFWIHRRFKTRPEGEPETFYAGL